MGQSLLVTEAIMRGKTQSLLPGVCRLGREIDKQANVVTSGIHALMKEEPGFKGAQSRGTTSVGRVEDGFSGEETSNGN